MLNELKKKIAKTVAYPSLTKHVESYRKVCFLLYNHCMNSILAAIKSLFLAENSYTFLYFELEQPIFVWEAGNCDAKHFPNNKIITVKESLTMQAVVREKPEKNFMLKWDKQPLTT